ncbi:biotin/lipoyl-binding protein [Neorhodopirellula lusitana]|uniref:biotin/lipoyl-binding protein n=1 Tax=Neorhodopirellula lusitana TaxID=445327 RepID=UPI003850FCE6
MTAAPTSEPFLFSPGGDAGGATGTQSPRVEPAHQRSPNGAGSAEAMVHQARQEIAQIVREVASAQRSTGGRDRYLRFLADRVMRAMAAHGVVIWRATDEGSRFRCIGKTQADRRYRDTQYFPEHRLGTVTDQPFDETEAAVHDCLLVEIAAGGEPAVVPPTPGASNREVPANPATHPAAIVPVQVDPNAALPTCLIEVFLEPGGSPNSQRGALRFLAQMADLAGEYLRSDQLRTLTRRLKSIDDCVRAVDPMQSLTTTREVENAWVDAAASVLAVPRVALCRVDRGRPKIVAVSHIDRIDQHSDAAERIRAAAEQGIQSRGPIAFAAIDEDGNAVIERVPVDAPDSESPQQMERREGVDRRKAAGSNEPDDTKPVQPIGVAALHEDSRWRMVLLDWMSGSDSILDAEKAALLERLLIGAEQAWTAAYRVEVIPGGRWWTRLTAVPSVTASPGTGLQTRKEGGVDVRHRSGVGPFRRRITLSVAIALTAGLLMWVPIPLTVPATGVIRPLDIDGYHSGFDATVQSIEVEHGQRVQRGDVLATLHSRSLTEQQTTLLGRRSVLVERRGQLNRNLMSAPDSGKLAGQSSGDEVNEEIASIDQQLAIISEGLEQLVLRARRDGRVDAWRVRERLAHRPLRRGDTVLNVIADQTEWVVDATVAQARVRHVDLAMQAGTLQADVATRWSPEQVQMTDRGHFGPVVTDPVDGTRGVIFRMPLSESPELGDQPLAETPARVAIRCGRTSIGQFLFEDVLTWVRTRAGMYL